MCGRYASTRSPQELAPLFQVPDVPAKETLAPNWNVAPTNDVWAVLERTPRNDKDDIAAAKRELRPLRWGLVPSWAKDVSIGARLINARVETVHEKPAFRRAFARRRCLLPADGYYEWRVAEDGGKQPFYIRPSGGGVLAMAGLYEMWRPAEDADEWLLTCTVITTE